ncbi:hypothetical protein OCF84_00065 [Shewanella xiamenensis]|uniref:hypothetical protein n=1 Tax=Shewanella xiamenensis TaxID=332186 RepID=UPI00214FFBED|nr:hypothetical protein [Shewanella xiamenensis]MCR4534515.1 hypothetical protein [Shewanella xiamenensis]WHF55720.1 hypothetical protein OCF84_00065 [Shewanella xiamenensis]
MKLIKAYADDIEQSITADEADKLYAEGKIKSKFSFQCPDDNCSAPVTCANLDRPKLKRKRDPYYKVVGEHSEMCNIAKDIEPQKKGIRKTTDIYSDSDEYIDHAIRLNLQPPSTKRPESLDKNEYGDDVDTSAKPRPSNTSDTGKRKIQRSKTLSSLIDAFLAKEPYMIQLPEVGVIDIRDFFVEINGQELSEFEDEFRIYYGKAWFNKKESGYSIVFDKTLTSADIVKRPSTYMPLDKLVESGFKRFKVNELDKLADKKPKTVFILSQTGPQVRNGYINFWCEGPEFMDYRS